MPLRKSAFALAALAAAALVDRPACARDDSLDERPGGEPAPAHLVAETSLLDPLVIGRYALTVDWLVASHHALTATAHADATNAPTQGFFSDTKYAPVSGFGGEVGWHLYARPGTLRGFWFGPSLLLASFSKEPSFGPSVRATSAGLAFDSGVRLGSDFVVFDLGIGLQVTHLTERMSGFVDDVAGSPRPRFLLAVGVAP